MSNNDSDTDTEPFIIKKIYTELFKDYVLNEREKYKNKDEKKNVDIKKLHHIISTLQILFRIFNLIIYLV